MEVIRLKDLEMIYIARYIWLLKEAWAFDTNITIYHAKRVIIGENVQRSIIKTVYMKPERHKIILFVSK